MLGLIAAAYFDDNILAEPMGTATEARDALLYLFDLFGTPPRPSKTLDMNPHQIFLGAAVTHFKQGNDSYVVVAPRESTRAQVLSDLDAATESRALSQAQAAKVRGRCGWMASNAYGRLGRIGSAVLKHLQYIPR